MTFCGSLAPRTRFRLISFGLLVGAFDPRATSVSYLCEEPDCCPGGCGTAEFPIADLNECLDILSPRCLMWEWSKVPFEGQKTEETCVADKLSFFSTALPDDLSKWGGAQIIVDGIKPSIACFASSWHFIWSAEWPISTGTEENGCKFPTLPETTSAGLNWGLLSEKQSAASSNDFSVPRALHDSSKPDTKPNLNSRTLSKGVSEVAAEPTLSPEWLVLDVSPNVTVYPRFQKSNIGEDYEVPRIIFDLPSEQMSAISTGAPLSLTLWADAPDCFFGTSDKTSLTWILYTPHQGRGPDFTYVINDGFDPSSYYKDGVCITLPILLSTMVLQVLLS